MDLVWEWENVASEVLPSPPERGMGSLPVSLPNPYPTPSERVTALIEALVWERDNMHSAVVRLEFEPAMEREVGAPWRRGLRLHDRRLLR